MTVLDQPVIARRFHGPPTSANGGYACGVVAAPIEGVAQVTLRTPPPLERPMQLVVTGTAVTLRDGDTVVADGAPANLELEPVAPVSLDEAIAAARAYPGFAWHPFPSCFVCGPDRAEGDGLRIFPGPVAGRTVAAAPWTPHASLDDGRGHVRREAVWAALDCPSYFGMQVVAPERITALLGRLVARIDRAPRIDEPCVAVGWLLGRDGRKIHAGSALYAADGELLGLARATWIEVPAAR
jgi:hypothetical protein